MCKKYSKLQCQGCPLIGSGCHFSIDPDNPESIKKVSEVIGMVEEWSKANPAKTRLSEFLKMFPSAPLVDGLPVVDPCTIDTDFKRTSCDFDNCGRQCRESYWNEVIE